ncbi:MAG TPA: pantoate--beta-alanine ligase [Alphaproteobacteria bacterium]|nr:pantoate--beta-alanine ligase [Alphaproteobacteria bacterium]
MSASVPIVRTVAGLRAQVAAWRADGDTVGLIPTMGALHEGHLSLVRAALSEYSRAVATLFVNPKQFNDPADYANYPRTEESDAAKLAAVGADLLYCPNPEEMYPEGFSTNVSVVGVSEGLCGSARPGHFDGVATVCTKLFLQSGADGAFFGEKDFQQLKVVERFVTDLDIPTTIHPCPTVRNPDGLALSSRNQHLGPRERAVAPALYRILSETAQALADGTDRQVAVESAKQAILAAGYDRIDYLEARREADLAPEFAPGEPARLFAAAFLGGTRLIDNVAIT